MFYLDEHNIHWPRYSPGMDTIVNEAQHGSEKVWEIAKEELPLWLGYLKREVEAPDLWVSLRQSHN